MRSYSHFFRCLSVFAASGVNLRGNLFLRLETGCAERRRAQQSTSDQSALRLKPANQMN